MKTLQNDFLRGIEKKLGEGKLIALELSETLGISKAEAYKKISSSSMLSTQQIQVLCNKYKVDFHILGNSGVATSTVNFLPFHATIFTVENYIGSIESFLQNIALATHKKLSCATDDIPIFHLFKYPELTAFKLHFWDLRINPTKKIAFDYASTNAEVLRKAYNIYSLYQTIPSVEVWTTSSLLNTLEQIKYAAQVGILKNKETGKIICRQVKQTLQDVEAYALQHSKTDDGTISFDWFFYNIIGCITYLAETDSNKTAYLRFNTFNTLQATNSPLCNEVKHWMDGLVQDSTGFSGQGSLQRNHYLEQAYKTCDDLMEVFNS